MSEEYVLRSAVRLSTDNVGASTLPQATDRVADVVVLSRVSDPSTATIDRDVYINASDKDREYLVFPWNTANLVYETSNITEVTTKSSDTTFQFNLDGLEITNVQVIQGPLPYDLDTVAGVLIYTTTTVPATAPTVTYDLVEPQLAVAINRTGVFKTRRFQARGSAWALMPGGDPHTLGAVPPSRSGSSITLKVVENAFSATSPPPILSVGDPNISGNRVTVTWVISETVWQSYVDGVVVPAQGEAVASAITGDVIFAPDIYADSENEIVTQWQISSFDWESLPPIPGTFSSAQNPITSGILNPVPAATERPLLRVAKGSYATTASSTDALTGEEDLLYDAITGSLTPLNSKYATAIADHTLYYDGLIQKDVVAPFAPVTLGSITADPSQTIGISDIDIQTYDINALILSASGSLIPDLVVVTDPSVAIPKPSEIPAQRAYIQDLGTGFAKVHLSFHFTKVHVGEVLVLSTGDFLIDQGITLRLQPSTGSYDVIARHRITQEAISANITASPNVKVPQVPLQDVAGINQDVFFEVRQGAKTTTLEPDVDVIYDFENSQISWASREHETQRITKPASSIKLPHEILLNRNRTFTLDQGYGDQPLVEGQDILVNDDLGSISFTIPVAATPLYEGFCTLTIGGGGGSPPPPVLVDDKANFAFQLDSPSNLEPQDREPKFRPLVIFSGPPAGVPEVVRVESQQDSVTLDLAQIPDLVTSTPLVLKVAYTIYDGAEIAFATRGEPVFLDRKRIKAYALTTVVDGQEIPWEAGQSYIFYDETLDTVLAHKVLEPLNLGVSDSTLTTKIDPYFLTTPQAQFTIYRDLTPLTRVFQQPPTGPDEVYIEDQGSQIGQVVLYPQDVVDYSTSVITFEPGFTTSSPPPQIEVLVGAATTIVGNHGGGGSYIAGVEIREDRYVVQPKANQFFFKDAFLAGQSLSVTYAATELGPPVTEVPGFEKRVALQGIAEGQTTTPWTFGEYLGEPSLIVNGIPDTDAVFTPTSITFGKPASAAASMRVAYTAKFAVGGEKLCRVAGPIWEPPISFVSGSQQVFRGDHTDALVLGSVLETPKRAFAIGAASYVSATDETVVTLSPSVEDPFDLLPSDPVNVVAVQDKTDLNATFQLPLKGQSFLKLYGDHTDVAKGLYPDKFLYLDQDPFRIVGVSVTDGATRIDLAQEIATSYASTAHVWLSNDIAYKAGALQLKLRNAVSLEGTKILMRVDLATGSGSTLKEGVEFIWAPDGTLVLDPVALLQGPPSPTEVWYASYLATGIVTPRKTITGSVLVPTLKSTYTRYSVAPDAFIGGELLGTYSIWNPDQLFWRVVSLTDFEAEEARAFLPDESTGEGPLTSWSPNTKVYKQGQATIYGPERHWRDLDRVARSRIQTYNDLAQSIEAYLQVVDGRVVGGKHGRFQFSIAAVDTAGGPDAVTGVIIPRYATSTGVKLTPPEVQAQDLDANAGYIRNSIDDLVLVSKAPFSFEAGVYKMRGTYVQAWEPSRTSRFYPERAQVVTMTPPDADGDGIYTWPSDTGEPLGDLQYESLLGVRSLSVRVPAAWVISHSAGQPAQIEAGMVYDPQDTEPTNPGSQNLTDGDESRSIPGFRVDDLVNLGRVVYDPQSGSRTEVLYATNMVVASVAGSTITLAKLDQPWVDVVYPGESLANIDLEKTDPATLDGITAPASGYVAATSTPTKADTIFGSVLQTFREGTDFGVDKAQGMLINVQLPSFLAALQGQTPPEPLTYLDASLDFKSTATDPHRFPALDGSSLNDDGLESLPYGSPILNSEVSSLGTETKAWVALRDRTEVGITVLGSLVDLVTITVPGSVDDPLTTPTKPLPYDTVLLEDEATAGLSKEYVVSDVQGTTLKLGAFPAYQTGVQFRIADVLAGELGTAVGGTSVWTSSVPRDFSNLEPGSLLTVGTSPLDTTYTVSSGAPGGVITVTGVFPANVTDVSALTFVGSSGSITSLHLFDAGFPVDNVVQGQVLEILNGRAAAGGGGGSYIINTATSTGVSLIEVRAQAPLDIPTYSTGPLAITTGSVQAQGSGNVDGGDQFKFLDAAQDFTPWGTSTTASYLWLVNKDVQNYVLTLDRYEIDTSGVGFVTTTTPITTTGSQEYYIAYAEFSAGSASNVGDTLIVRSPSLPGLGDIAVGDTLKIGPSSVNGGIYKVLGISTTGFYLEIQLDEPLYTNLGSSANSDPLVDTFPIRFTTSRPRRGSQELLELRDTLSSQRFVYDEAASAPPEVQAVLSAGSYSSLNPSGPAMQVLEEQLAPALFSVVETALDGGLSQQGSDWILTSSSMDFSLYADGDYVLISQAALRGYFVISEVLTSTSVRLSEPLEFSTSYTASLQAASNVSFKGYSGGRFNEARTYEVFLYDTVNVLDIIDRIDSGILATIGDPQNLTTSDPFVSNRGEPLPNTVQAHLTQIQERLDWVRGLSPTLVDEMEAVVKGSENLYDLRFKWIDFRVNMVDGSLVQTQRLEDNRLRAQKRSQL